MYAAEYPVYPSELSSNLHDNIVIVASFYGAGSILSTVIRKGIEASYQSTVRDFDIRR